MKGLYTDTAYPIPATYSEPFPQIIIAMIAGIVFKDRKHLAPMFLIEPWCLKLKVEIMCEHHGLALPALLRGGVGSLPLVLESAHTVKQDCRRHSAGSRDRFFAQSPYLY